MLLPYKKSGNEKHSLSKILLPVAISLGVAFTACEKKQDTSNDKQQIIIEQTDSVSLQKKRDIGKAYIDNNNYSEALKIYQEIEKIYTNTYKIDNPKNLLRNTKRYIGIIFLRQGNDSEAIKQYKQGLELAIACNNREGIIVLYTLIGEAHRNLGQTDSVLNNFFKARDIAEKAKDLNKKEINRQVEVGTDIARWYLEQENNVAVAKAYRKKCIALNKGINDKQNNIQIDYDLGDLELHQGNNEKAINYYMIGIKEAQMHKSTRLEEIGYTKMKDRYLKSNNFTKAREYRNREDSLKNKRINEQNIQKVNQLNIQHETDKKEQQIELQDTKIEQQEGEKKKMLWMIMTALATALGAGGLGVIFYRQKGQLHKKNLEISYQKQRVEITNSQLKEKNDHITESITYAQRIQEAILPSKEIREKIYPESFVFFQAKDIVSGDFYRFAEKNTKKFIAAIDCTGHGVPGAMVSILGHDTLNEALQQENTSPADILEYMNISIHHKLNTDINNKRNDGMDMSIIMYDTETQQYTYAGAVNPVCIVRQNEGTYTAELIKGNKIPIGTLRDSEDQKYSNRILDVKKGDMIYMFSDGYQDQFGKNENGKEKKISKSGLQKTLEKIAHLTLEEQEQELKKSIDARRGDCEQIDDILVIGMKV